MSDAWDDWEAADEAGAFENIQVKGASKPSQTAADLRYELDVRQLQKSSNKTTAVKIQSDDVAPEFQTQHTAAFQVRILKRPDAQKRDGPSPEGSARPTSETPPLAGGSGGSGNGAGAVKSLQQREAEYLKARERIFGTGTPTPNPTGIETNSSLKTTSPAPASGAKAAASAPVVREPKGPDGSRGFAGRGRGSPGGAKAQ